MAETIWSVFPPILTIVLALATQEVYMSLLIGIFSGAMLYSNFNVIQAILTMFAVMEEKVGGNVNILVFLVVLGMRLSRAPARRRPMVNGRGRKFTVNAARCF